MELSYKTTLYNPNTDEEQEVLIWYEYSPAFSKYKLPDDYAEIEIIKATNLFGDSLEPKWNLLAEEWMNYYDNQGRILEYETEERNSP